MIASHARATSLLAAALASVGCAPPCEDVPLSPLTTTPRFVVEVDYQSASGALDGGGIPLPGIDAGTPDAGAPSTLNAFAALPLYAADGALIHDDWIDTRTRWAGAQDTFDSHDRLPWSPPAGELPLLLEDAPSIVAFSIPSGAIAYDVRFSLSGASMRDLVAIDDTRAMLSLSDGRVLVVDRASGSIVSQIDLRAWAGAGASADRLATLGDGTMRVVVGLTGDIDGAVAVVDASAVVVTVVSIAGLRHCGEVSALADGSIAVLCAGSGDALASDAGLALLEPTPTAMLAATHVIAASTVSSTHPPTNALVAMSEGWVAAISRGDASTPDALLAIHLASGGAQTLSIEPWSPRWGPALGEGAFASEIGTHGELWWPSVANGVLRFRIEGDGASARIVGLPSVLTPDCLRMPARRVRALP